MGSHESLLSVSSQFVSKLLITTFYLSFYKCSSQNVLYFSLILFLVCFWWGCVQPY